jgi:OOP family OmpA-OmpF porin
MRKAFAFALVFAAVVAMVAGPLLADCGKDCKCCSCKKKCDKEITEFLYDVTFPWPFRQKAADSDGDGVPDKMDRCPNTPKGMKVNEFGCTVAETQFLDTGIFSTSEIRFAVDEATIHRDSYQVIDRIAEVLVQWPQLKIEIGGHTDSSGSPEMNQKLSEARAKAVLEYMTRNSKIEKSQYTYKGYGETKPIASNDTEEGRAKNRRVDFKVLNKELLKK